MCMHTIIQELSISLHLFMCKLTEDTWFKQSIYRLDSNFKKEYLKLLFRSYKATNLKNYNDEENIMFVLETNAHIKLFLKELERLEIKFGASEYLKNLIQQTK